MKKNKTTLIIAIVLLAIAAYFIATQSKGTIRTELKDFAVQDTGSITKIFLADKFGNSSTLVKEKPGKWIVNGKYPAKKEAIITLLATVKNIEVRSPVGKGAFNNVLKDVSSRGIKVEIYQDNKLTKTYYVGGETQDQLGTFMMIENSSAPFIIHIPGFDGFLTTRYITSENEWRLKNVFDSGIEEISSVISEDLQYPQNSFMISRQPNGEFLLTTWPGKNPVPDVEQNKVQNYLSGFTYVNYEKPSYDTKQLTDSIRAVGPFRTLTLTDTQNKTRKVSFYYVPLSERSREIIEMQNVNKPPFDTEKMYALMDSDSDFIVVQYFVFDKFFRTPDDFKITLSAKAKK